MALGLSPYADKPVSPIALVGETEHDAREVMVEGISGLMAVHRHSERPSWIASRRRLEWPNGSIAQIFSAEDPDSLRGPQFAAAWLDELAKWKHAEATFNMLQFGLRLGERPRQVITTTPRPTALIKKLMRDTGTLVTRAPPPTVFTSRRRSSTWLRAVTPARSLAARRFRARSSRSAPTRCGRVRRSNSAASMLRLR
jgi:phage terminase large subunit-like protein